MAQILSTFISKTMYFTEQFAIRQNKKLENLRLAEGP